MSLKLTNYRLERLKSASPIKSSTIRVLAIVLAFIITGIAIQIGGKSALELAHKAVHSTFGSKRGIFNMLILATPITLTGFAVLLGMKMGAWNLGIEGQFLVGALAATVAGLYLPAPPALSILIMFVAGALGGALWVLIPALAGVYKGANELITTLLMNFVAVSLVAQMSSGPLKDPDVGLAMISFKIPHSLPTMFGSHLHIGIFAPLILGIILALLLKYTRWGYEVTIIGTNRQAAKYAGMQIKKRLFITFLISGAIAGIAGMIELAGTTYRLSASISPGYGYIGFLIATLANYQPIALLIAGILYAALLNSGIVLKTQGFSIHFVIAITGLILLFSVIGETVAKYRIVRRNPVPEGITDHPVDP